MAWYFRTSRKLGPVRLTASKSGLSVSAGGKGVRQTVSTRGRRTTTWSLPGTGIFWRKSKKL
jgi:hypothetical protein